MPLLGDAFIAAALVGAAIAAALMIRPEGWRVPPLAGQFCAARQPAPALRPSARPSSGSRAASAQ
jgi:hypothetical protein